MKIFILILLLSLTQICVSESVQHSLSQLLNQEKYLISGTTTNQKITKINHHIDQFDDIHQLAFYVIASLEFKDEYPYRALAFSEKGLNIAQKLGDESKSLFFEISIANINFNLKPEQFNIENKNKLAKLQARIESLDDSIDKAMVYNIYARINDKLENRFQQLSAIINGIRIVEQLTDVSIKGQVDQVMGRLFVQHGNYFLSMKNFEEGKKSYQKALDVFIENNDIYNLARTQFNLGLIAYEQQVYQLSADYFEDALKNYTINKNEFGMAIGNFSLGMALNQIGQPDKAIELLKKAMSVFESKETYYRLAFVYLYLGEAYYLTGDTDKADTLFLQSWEMAKKYLRPLSQSRVLKKVLKLLSFEKFQTMRDELINKMIDIQSLEVQIVFNDVKARSEAEFTLKEKLLENKLLDNLSQYQAQKLKKERLANTQNKIFITALTLLLILMFISVLRQVKLNKENSRLANTDFLTGILNRRSFYKRLNAIYSDIAKKTYFLIILDIDYFKKINDGYGHDVGDFALVELTKLIKKENDKVYECFARIGGEEFAIIFPSDNITSASKWANELRSMIEQHDWVLGKMQLNLTISLGLTVIDRNKPINTVIKSADRALYLAKEKGRNRLEVDSSFKINST